MKLALIILALMLAGCVAYNDLPEPKPLDENPYSYQVPLIEFKF